MSPERPRRLGRGLEALLGGAQTASPGSLAPETEQGELKQILVTDIRPNPFQPRHVFQDSDLAELRASLEVSGMLQPIVVRRTASSYELISGERRLRAATQLGWERIPAVIRAADTRMMLTLALIENLQRTDLNPMDEARGFQRLHDEFALTHQQIAEAIGKDRSTVTNLLRFLSLPGDVQLLLQEGKISMGHAKALLALPDVVSIKRIAAEIVDQGLSVRQTERRVRTASKNSQPTSERVTRRVGPASSPNGPVFIRNIEGRVRQRLQTDVSIAADVEGKGTLSISFYSLDDLERILEIIGANREF